jgi:hypothetical protein
MLGGESKGSTRKDPEPAPPSQSCEPAVGAAEPESLQCLVILETLGPKEPLHDVDHLGNVGCRGHLSARVHREHGVAGVDRSDSELGGGRSVAW